jgi:hypothetical protein
MDDDEKENCWIGQKSWYHRVAGEYRIPEITVSIPLKPRYNQQTQKSIPHIWIPQPQLPRIFVFFFFFFFFFLGNESANQELWISIF